MNHFNQKGTLIRPLDRRSGQTLIFMALIIVMMVFAALFYFDVNKILHVKGISRNGGDAAALSGARWQAISLNLIGSLNIAQAAALTDSLSSGVATSPDSEIIVELQKRIAFSGPMFGVLTAQQAGKKNRLHNNEIASDSFSSAATYIETAIAPYYEDPFAPSGGFPTGWHEVADMVRLVAQEGTPITIPNTLRVYDGGHLLLNQSFYHAISARNWCWFWNHRDAAGPSYSPNPFTALNQYSSWDTYWPDLPEIERDTENSPYFRLNLTFRHVIDRLQVLPSGTQWDQIISDFQDILDDTEIDDPTLYEEIFAEWVWYNQRWSGGWLDALPWEMNSWDRDVRRQYDYPGTDTFVGVSNSPDRQTDFGTTRPVEWTASAKPFGYLEGNVPPNTYGIVLPAYDDIRIIPVDSSMSAQDSGNPDLSAEWEIFIHDILPIYMAIGPFSFPDDSDYNNNFYLGQLRVWEEVEFRRDGVDWLAEFSGSCIVPSPGGGGPDGGNRRGH